MSSAEAEPQGPGATASMAVASSLETGRGGARWVVASAVALTLHAGAIVLLSAHLHVPQAEHPRGAIEMDLPPLAAESPGDDTEATEETESAAASAPPAQPVETAAADAEAPSLEPAPASEISDALPEPEAVPEPASAEPANDIAQPEPPTAPDPVTEPEPLLAPGETAALQPATPASADPVEPPPVAEAPSEIVPDALLAPDPEVALPAPVPQTEPDAEPVEPPRKHADEPRVEPRTTDKDKERTNQERAARAREEAARAKVKAHKDQKAAAGGKAATSGASTERKRAAAAASGTFDPNPIYRPQPAYPASARASRTEGTVVVAYTISPSGAVSNVRVVSSSPSGVFSGPTIAAVSQWRFKPSARGGSRTTTIRFKLR
ncbi:MAG: TonB family protein [Hyphomicrobiaceae bacterium]|nr:TonB family protein [Hyphomicrobiaceae bacterium]